MARTNAQKRQARLEANAAQQERRRERMWLEGIPDTGKLDAALVESLRFVVSTLSRDIEAKAPVMTGPALAALITKTAKDILVRREGFDAGHTKTALARRLKRSPLHLEPSYIPSLVPDPVAQATRAAQAASTPLLPQTASHADD